MPNKTDTQNYDIATISFYEFDKTNLTAGELGKGKFLYTAKNIQNVEISDKVEQVANQTGGINKYSSRAEDGNSESTFTCEINEIPFAIMQQLTGATIVENTVSSNTFTRKVISGTSIGGRITGVTALASSSGNLKDGLITIKSTSTTAIDVFSSSIGYVGNFTIDSLTELNIEKLGITLTLSNLALILGEELEIKVEKVSTRNSITRNQLQSGKEVHLIIDGAEQQNGELHRVTIFRVKLGSESFSMTSKEFGTLSISGVKFLLVDNCNEVYKKEIINLS